MRDAKPETNNKKRAFLGKILLSLIVTGALFSFFMGSPCLHIKKAKKAIARAAMKSLSDSIELYYKPSNKLPLSTQHPKDAELQTGPALMNILCGINSADSPLYFEYKQAKGKKNDYWDGLHRTESTAELFGPWKNKKTEDRYYSVIFDYDGDNSVREPEELGGQLIENVRHLIYHKGKDGKTGGDYNADNIYSWK